MQEGREGTWNRMCVALALHKGPPKTGEKEKGGVERWLRAFSPNGLDLLGVVRGQMRRDGRVESSGFRNVTR